MPRPYALGPVRLPRHELLLPALAVAAYCLTSGPLGQVASAQRIKTAQVKLPQTPATEPATRETPEQGEPVGTSVAEQENVFQLPSGSRRVGHSAISYARSQVELVPEPATAGMPALDPEADLNALDAAASVASESNQQPYDLPDQNSVTSGSSAVLDGRTVACQAAACWPLAKLLEQRAATLMADASHCHQADQRAAAMQASFLRRQAARQRDIAAANALRAYYSWIANRDQLALVSAGFELQKEQVATQAALIERGVAVDDPTALERKRLELRDSQVQLLANDRRLAQTLLQLTCCSSDLHNATVEDLEVRSSVLACDRLVAFALEHRQDYLALVELCRGLDQQTARSIASLLTPLAGGVALKALDLNCLEKILLAAHGDEAVAQISRELRLAVDMQRRLIEQSTCERCLALATAYERVEIAQQIVATWDERIATLNRLGQLGEARGQELAIARSEQVKARSSLLERQLAAKLAEIDLAEAMGDLAPRCCRGQPWLITSY